MSIFMTKTDVVNRIKGCIADDAETPRVIHHGLYAAQAKAWNVNNDGDCVSIFLFVLRKVDYLVYYAYPRNFS
jgi:hypothetical protein